MNVGSCSSASTVAKALQVLQIIADSVAAGKRTTLTEIAKTAGFAKPTTHRYLQELETFGLIKREPDGTFSLGHKTIELYHICIDSYDLRQIALENMNALAQETLDTIYLGVLDGLEVFYLERIESPLPISPRAKIGERNELYCTGLGKAILAFLPDHKVEQVIGLGLVKKTEQTLTDPETLRAELEVIRKRGFAIDNMENEEYVKCVAAPVFSADAEVIAAVSVSGASFRMDDTRLNTELGPKVVAACQEISRKLGCKNLPIRNLPHTQAPMSSAKGGATP
jgi:IclR family acetate operon transcriptional repressor